MGYIRQRTSSTCLLHGTTDPCDTDRELNRNKNSDWRDRDPVQRRVNAQPLRWPCAPTAALGLGRFRPEAREVGERAAGRAFQAQSGGAGTGDEPAATVEVWVDGDLADDEPA